MDAPVGTLFKKMRQVREIELFGMFQHKQTLLLQQVSFKDNAWQ